MPSRDRDAFWSMIPLRGKIMFFGAVFCLFAPGIVLPIRIAADAPAIAVTIAFVSSGLIGMSWALAFTRHLGFLALAIGIQVGTLTGFGGLMPDWAWPRAVAFDWVGLVSMILIAAGYGLFVAFISTEGRRSLRERTELALAQQIHTTLVPDLHLTTPACEVLARSMPSTEVGGDLVDAIETDDALDLYLGDVTGHGVRSGVVMAMVKSAIHTLQRTGAGMPELLARVNDILEDLTDPGIFVTFAALRIEHKPNESGARIATCALAGHLPILWWQAAERRIERIDNEALPLGVVSDQAYNARRIECAKGDLLVVLTDGFIEVADKNGRQLGLDGFESLLLQNAHRDLEGAFDALVNAVRDIGPIEDDQTLLLVRVV